MRDTGKNQHQDNLLRIEEVLRPLGPIPLGRSTWWEGIRDGRFPRPVKLGRVSAWRESDILALIQNGAERPERRRQTR